MSTQLKLRRGTTAQHSTFTGAEAEVTVDTTKDTLVVHDGVTAGGVPLMKESGTASTEVISFGGTQFYKASNGDVGIGVIPTAKLHVAGGGLLGTSLTNPIAFTGSSSSNAGIGSYNADTDMNIYAAGTGNIKFVTGSAWSAAGALTTVGTTKAIIDSSGKLGLGSNPPVARLDIRYDNATAYDATNDGAQLTDTASLLVRNDNGSTNTFSQLVLDTAGTNQSIARIVAIRTGTSSNDLAFVVEGGNVKREAMRIASDGQQYSVVPGGTTVYPEYKCRAWVNFNGTGTVAIRASGNVSSITDNGTGNYTVNFTTAMPDANYCTLVQVNGLGGGASNGPGENPSSKTTSAINVTIGTAGGAIDYSSVNVSIFR